MHPSSFSHYAQPQVLDSKLELGPAPSTGHPVSAQGQHRATSAQAVDPLDFDFDEQLMAGPKTGGPGDTSIIAADANPPPISSLKNLLPDLDAGWMDIGLDPIDGTELRSCVYVYLGAYVCAWMCVCLGSCMLACVPGCVCAWGAAGVGC